MAAGPPTTLNPRHVHVALMVAAGATSRQIAEALGLSERRVAIIRQSPLFQRLVQQQLDAIRQASLQRVLDRLHAEADATLDVVIKFRDMAYAPKLPDGTPFRSPEDKRLSLAAAKELLARQIPVETKHTEERRVTKVMLSGEDIRRMFAAMSEDGGVPASARNVTPVAPAPHVDALTLDAAIAAARAAESAAAPADDDDAA